MPKNTRGESHADRFPGGTPLHPSDMVRWDKVGQEVIGRFIAVKKFKKGHIGTVETENGRVSFSAPTILADILDGIEKGTNVAIVYSADEPSKKQGKAPDGKPWNPVKRFEVYALPGEEDDAE